MRFHLLACPNIQTTKVYYLDGFAQMTIRFAKLLKELGHFVYLYASEENEAPCDELVMTITKEEQEILLAGEKYQDTLVNEISPLWKLANGRMIREISKRKRGDDFIALIGGNSQKPVSLAHSDLITIEYSIGYVGCFSKHRVYQSTAWRHANYGYNGMIEGQFLDTVIPGFVEPEDFTFRANKEPFALYVGRLIAKKGVAIACKVAKEVGVPLKIMGHGDISLVTDGAEYLGTLPDPERNDLLSRASAVFCPTTYVEPFNNVAVEAQICGTPVISTDFGGFTETIEQGKTGFRCSTLPQFTQALRDVGSLDPLYIRERALAKYSIHAVKHLYQSYFELLQEFGNDEYDVVPGDKVFPNLTSLVK